VPHAQIIAGKLANDCSIGSHLPYRRAATLFGVRNEPRLDGRGLCRSGRLTAMRCRTRTIAR